MRSIALATIITVSVVAGLAMPALADDVAQCKQSGYKPGTALFLQCLKLYQQQRAQEQQQGQAQAPAAEDAEQSAAKASWCVTTSFDGGTNCGFETYEQCKAAASGGYGTCSPSPYAH
jgi:Protein of unknown function (DUF3551)